MANPVSIREQIIQELVNVLKGITTANGFGRTVKTVTRRWPDLEFDVARAPILYVNANSETRSYNPGRIVTASLRIDILGGIFDEAKSLTGALETDLHDFEYDVERAINTNYSLGARTSQTRIRAAAYDGGSVAPRGAFLLEVEIDYRYKANNPEAQE